MSPMSDDSELFRPYKKLARLLIAASAYKTIFNMGMNADNVSNQQTSDKPEPMKT